MQQTASNVAVFDRLERKSGPQRLVNLISSRRNLVDGADGSPNGSLSTILPRMVITASLRRPTVYVSPTTTWLVSHSNSHKSPKYPGSSSGSTASNPTSLSCGKTTAQTAQALISARLGSYLKQGICPKLGNPMIG
jgi:hypothetical protein